MPSTYADKYTASTVSEIGTGLNGSGIESGPIIQVMAVMAAIRVSVAAFEFFIRVSSIRK